MNNQCVKCKKIAKELNFVGSIIDGVRQEFCDNCMKCETCNRQFKDGESIKKSSWSKFGPGGSEGGFSLYCQECDDNNNRERERERERRNVLLVARTPF